MPIDLRSDTLTRPGAAMRAAMAAAELGDDVYGEDPSVNALQERVAALLGKQAALFVPSGTMGNQLALLAQTQRGDEVVVGEGAHIAWYESGAGAALAGVQFAIAGQGGLFDREQLEAAIKPRTDYYPRTSLVALENTHNRAGGRVFPQAQLARVVELARERGLALHLDGARLWNASVASGLTPAALAEGFDTVNVCFSKGLGAPVGSALAGSSELILRARRLRKMLGGGMRQAGVLAVAASYALDHHLPRLVEDHRAAAQLAAAVTGIPGVALRGAVETNIAIIDLLNVPAAVAEAALARRGLLLSVIGPRSLRLVTHLDISASDVELGVSLLSSVLSELSAGESR